MEDSVGKVAFDDEVDGLLGGTFLLDGDFSGVLDSAASREMISLPVASLSGVVPNLASAAFAASACSMCFNFCGILTLRTALSRSEMVFQSERALAPAMGDENKVFATAGDATSDFGTRLVLAALVLENNSFLPFDLQSGMLFRLESPVVICPLR